MVDVFRRANARAALAWLFAIAAYAALVDLCVETFAAGSALRWSVLIVGIAFVAVSGLFWRSNGAGAKAEYAFVVSAALVAYAGWALGLGDARTLHAFGRPTGTVIAALLLVALAVAAARLLPARGVPVPLRIAAGVLVLYASVPLVAASFHGGLDTALDGTALGIPGPFWSRGAYLGIEVLLPLAIVVFVVVIVVALVRRDPPATASAARIALALLLVTQMGALEVTTLALPSLAFFERPRLSTSVAASSPASSAPVTSGGIGGALGSTVLEGADALANGPDSPRQRVAAFVSKVVAAQRYVRRADFDTSALAATLPADPNAIFAYVRDTIALDAYDGAMRGANGTLMRRAGNADDKALLLAALLQAKSIATRFASTTLSANEIAELAAAARTATPAPTPTAMPDAFFTDLGIDKERNRSAVAARAASDAAYLRAGLAFANDRAPSLWNSVAHAAAPNATPSTPAIAPDATHVFVQASIGGRFVDFDPSLARLAPNAHLGGGAVTTAMALAPERFHVVRIRFVLAYGSGSRRVESTAFGRTIRASDVGGAPISLGIGSSSATSLETVATAQTFFPYADVGKAAMTGNSFALRDARGERLTSARLVLETAGPGIVTKTHTRLLWDVTSTTEPALALVHGYEMLVVPGPYGDSFATATMLDTVAQMQPLLLYAATPPAQRVLPALRDLEPAYPMALLDYVDRELRIANALSAETPAVRFAFDRPDIVMLSNGFERAGSAVRGTVVVDIVDNGLHAEAADPDVARLANVKRGLLDTYVEQHVLAFLPTPIVGAPQAFAGANRSGTATVVVSAGSSLPSGVPARSLGPLRETISQGDIAVAMSGPVDLAGTTHYAWWAIDPHTGNTVGRMDDGSGDAAAEESALLYYSKRVAMAYTLIGIVINGPQSVEDAEISIFLSGENVISQALSALKGEYDLGGGSYGSDSSNGNNSASDWNNP
ncbi:MAG: hypothetical protein IAI48_08320 [Candidatus Eremiobacteraeota bacterium]|nr:hypothetical protein [Candidatus Eremiobacteraeota bacterium]